MINKWLLEEIIDIEQGDVSGKHPFLTYNSLIEEALKIALKADLHNERLVVVKENTFQATNIYNILKSFMDEDELVAYLPEESLRNEAIMASFENKAERINALYRILKGSVKVVVTTGNGITRHLPEPSLLRDSIINLKVGDVVNRDDLVKKLENIGYEYNLNVERPLNYSKRGMVLDVYSINYDYPVRIEFFDDEIESIRYFDINTKRTVKEIDEAIIIFGTDIIFDDEQIIKLKEELSKLDYSSVNIDLDFIVNKNFSKDNLYPYYSYFKNAHLFDYLEGYTYYLSNKEAIRNNYNFNREETLNFIQEMAEAKKLPLRFSVFADLNTLLDQYDTVEGVNFFDTFSAVEEIDMPLNSLSFLMNIVIRQSRESRVLICASDQEAKSIIDHLVESKVPYHLCTDRIQDGINLAINDLYEGFEIKKLNLVVYTSKELFNHQKFINRYSKVYNEATAINSYEELKVNDYVVHNDYGIGKYLGINQKSVDGVKKDYLTIAYAGNAVLYVPINKFALVRKFVSSGGYVPRLNKLGSNTWKNTKEKAQKNIDDIAERLMELYANRNKHIGFKHLPDDDYQLAFESEFPYELTEDQAKAIREVKQDMESDIPMDRLLCGDVAFGKTEVAIRACMKAVLSGKQVAYLCPTTILSLQHYNTFAERFRNYPVTVKLVNRYNDPNTQNQIITDVRLGKVDVVIGTHRLLSKDIVFNDLGLLIIDEEQRFGVKQKERIKELKNNVDVLSLSATPIPRTLQMSLAGIRSLSTLNEAPDNRYPIQTYVVEESDDLIRSAISRELSRNGQVFYLHNDTSSIFRKADQIKKLVKYSKVMVVHGQMSKEEIEDTMMAFYNNEANVLVCTTIIETGLDIPNANTIIVENAQNFGLAQLYQIKGRVGRSSRIAYAYLMVPKEKSINENGVKRLQAIKEFTSLGSGYKIAMRDLSIRGAGDLLGEDQSGFMNEIGFDLYMDMLNTAIKTKKGEILEEKKEIKHLNLPIESYIPIDFSDNDLEKLDLYQRLEGIDNFNDLMAFYLEVSDKFGKLPKQVDSLFNTKKLELIASQEMIDSFRYNNNRLTITLTKSISDQMDGLKLFEYVNSLSQDLKIEYKNQKMVFSIDYNRNNPDLIMKLLGNLDNLKRID
ncbi:MAG: transcription-repair coupling factor [Erysipelotrichaceae bacterium]|nr:transcription-repair coupling factor [Erysipelotrichaceae bacterium]